MNGVLACGGVCAEVEINKTPACVKEYAEVNWVLAYLKEYAEVNGLAVILLK